MTVIVSNTTRTPGLEPGRSDGFAGVLASELESLTEGGPGSAAGLRKPRFEHICGLHGGMFMTLPL